jgi:hypothetical protein
MSGKGKKEKKRKKKRDAIAILNDIYIYMREIIFHRKEVQTSSCSSSSSYSSSSFINEGILKVID